MTAEGAGVTRRDFQVNRHIGEKLSAFVSREGSQISPSSLFTRVKTEVINLTGEGLPETRGGEGAEVLVPHLDRFLEILRTDRARLLPMLVGLDDRYRMGLLVDILQPPTFNAMTGMPAAKSSWRRPFSVFQPRVVMKDRSHAMSSFLTKFTDSFRRMATCLGGGGPSHIGFTVDCKKYDYHLEYFPQFYYSPKVFGSNPTRPVTDVVPVNNYYFQGWFEGKKTLDPGLHYAGPGRTKTMLRAF